MNREDLRTLEGSNSLYLLDIVDANVDMPMESWRAYSGAGIRVGDFNIIQIKGTWVGGGGNGCRGEGPKRLTELLALRNA